MVKNVVFLSLVACFCFACGDDEPKPFGTDVSALRNGEQWSGVIFGGKTEGINGKFCGLPTNNITIHRLNNAGFRRESLVFSKIYSQLGTYTLNITRSCDVDTLTGANYYTLQEDGDVLVDIYVVLESEDNFITVTSVNSGQTEIGGTFQVTFVIDAKRPKVDPFAPDTIRFTEGNFFTRIRE